MAGADWAAIKTEYITGNCSYRELSQKYGLGHNTICERGKKEGWVEARRAYREKTVGAAVKEASRKNARKLASLMRSADAMCRQIEKALGDSDQFYKFPVEEVENVNGIPTKSMGVRCLDMANTKAIKDMTAAIKDMTTVMRNLYELPTQAEQEAQRVAAERLRLEQQRADDGSSGAVIVIEGDADGYGG